MADVTIRPASGVYDWYTLDTSPPTPTEWGYVPPSTVGAAPQWGDQNDASYSRHEAHYDRIDAGSIKRTSSMAAADFAALEHADTIDPTINVRVMAETATGHPDNKYRLYTMLFNRVTGDRYAWTTNDYYFPADQAVHELATPSGWQGVGTAEAAAAALEAGELSALVDIAPYITGTTEVPVGSFWSECYEVWLGATTKPPLRYPAAGPPLRVVQRGNDGYGITGGRRVVGVATAQGSNRRGGAIW